MPGQSRNQLIKANRHHRLVNKALEQQFIYLKDRLKRQTLLLEKTLEYFGLRAYQDEGTVSIRKIPGAGAQEVFYMRKRRTKSNEPRLVYSKSKGNRRHRRGASV